MKQDKLPKSYEFAKLTGPYPGCGYGRYFAWTCQDFGRAYFRRAVQAFPEDLNDDQWGPGNLDITDVG
jgi:hypothetical protein